MAISALLLKATDHRRYSREFHLTSGVGVNCCLLSFTAYALSVSFLMWSCIVASVPIPAWTLSTRVKLGRDITPKWRSSRDKSTARQIRAKTEVNRTESGARS